jgi:hypothetical protein
MEVVTRRSGAAKTIGKFCSSCGVPLDSDAAFCLECGQPQLQAVRSGVMPEFSMIPQAIWAGILQVFFALGSLAVLVLGFSQGGNSLTQSQPFRGLLMLLLLFAQFSVQITLVSGLLAQRHWARPLYIWTLGPLVLSTLILVAQGEVLTGTSGFVVGVAWVGLTVLQAAMVMRNGPELTE